jgi:aminopeptidase
MADPRHRKLAEVLINYSLAIKPSEKLLIVGSELTAPLMREAYRAAIEAGAYVYTDIRLNGLREILFKQGRDDQLQYVSELDWKRVEFFDATLHIMGDSNTRQYGGVDSKRMSMWRKARAPLSKRDDERTAAGESRWCLTLYPTEAYAQDAGLSLTDYEDFVYEADLLNTENPVAGWQKVHDDQQKFADYLNQHDEIHIVAPGTDIRYRVGGHKWINCDGKVNFPDGEVFTAPHIKSVSGHVTFTYPAIYDGNEVENVKLTFENGVVVKSEASRGLEFLNTMLDTDEGARRLGEVAFGTNYGIQRFTRELLFDEKIGGTMHMALGAAYSECFPAGADASEINESGVHWDMVCDLREGEATADGEVFYKNGRFVI